MKYFYLFLILLLTACPGPECTSNTLDGSQVFINIVNTSSEPIVISYTTHEITINAGETKLTNPGILWNNGCGTWNSGPMPNTIATHYLWIKPSNPINNDFDKGHVLFGGPLAIYETFQTRWNNSSDTYYRQLSAAPIFRHSLFFIPGSQARQDLGLLVANPTGTELFTSLDPWRPYVSDGFTLNVDVRDLQTGDIGLSFSGMPAN